MSRFIHHLVHAIGHGAKHARDKGEHDKANSLILVGIGIVLLPIPILGVPLLIWGLCRLWTQHKPPPT
jgi:hypothetical protein